MCVAVGGDGVVVGGVVDEKNASADGNPFKISARQLCKYNRYFETLRVMDVASEKFKEEKDKMKAAVGDTIYIKITVSGL